MNLARKLRMAHLRARRAREWIPAEEPAIPSLARRAGSRPPVSGSRRVLLPAHGPSPVPRSGGRERPSRARGRTSAYPASAHKARAMPRTAPSQRSNRKA